MLLRQGNSHTVYSAEYLSLIFCNMQLSFQLIVGDLIEKINCQVVHIQMALGLKTNLF